MKIAVFCGSGAGASPIFAEEAQRLGRLLVECGHELVYGGGKTGLMGVIADTVLQEGGKVYGVMPVALSEREIQHTGVTELFIVSDMHERKAKMAELADAFVAMPGGIGTLEEIFEIWTWGQLGYHQKACGFLNVDGYYDQLLGFIKTVVDQEFIKPEYADMMQVSTDPEELLDMLRDYEAPQEKWS
ncbi:TIGR00730 family Rossman fold protein [Neptunomonas japonica]|uniref:LOG family protein n=1 Tax=Neptunomonas japonica TaxID=417574 RepID=UPI0003F9FECA|nr:TIGR00730 family Rossman fold protein [Neptunomonas japonica]